MTTVQSLVFVRPRRLEWREAPAPVLEATGDALVRPLASTTCDLDRLVLLGRTPARGPFPFGHEAAAEVVDLDDDVAGLAVGDLVAVPWQVGCGTCDRCRAGMTGRCGTGADYGLADGARGGLFDEVVRVPRAQHVLTPLDPALDLTAVAAAGDDLAVALGLLGPHLRGRCGSRVLVLGAGSTALHAVDTALALGAWRVVHADRDLGRRAVARSLGAETVERPDTLTDGADVVLDAGFDPAALAAGLRLLAPGGVVVSLQDADVALPQLGTRGRRVPFRTARARARGHVPEVLELVRAGRLRPDLLVTDVHPMSAAPEVLAEFPTKPVFLRDPLTSTG